MKKRFRRAYVWFRIQLRVFRLLFLRLEKPEDAKTPEEMLDAIKKRINAED